MLRTTTAARDNLLRQQQLPIGVDLQVLPRFLDVGALLDVHIICKRLLHGVDVALKS